MTSWHRFSMFYCSIRQFDWFFTVLGCTRWENPSWWSCNGRWVNVWWIVDHWRVNACVQEAGLWRHWWIIEPAWDSDDTSYSCGIRKRTFANRQARRGSSDIKGDLYVTVHGLPIIFGSSVIYFLFDLVGKIHIFGYLPFLLIRFNRVIITALCCVHFK